MFEWTFLGMDLLGTSFVKNSKNYPTRTIGYPASNYGINEKL